MWSFVQKKANNQRIWIAMDATTRQIIAFHVGDRSGYEWQGDPLGEHSDGLP